MLFSDPVFLFLFLPIVWGIFYLCQRYQQGMLALTILLLASCFFYGYWNWHYLPLIIFSVLGNFVVGNALLNKQSKLLLTFGISANVAVLGYYKYTNFFITTINALSGLKLAMLSIVLPLAISFHTFQQIAYLVDCYRKDAEHYTLFEYFLFVVFFPQLIAGPIVHHTETIPEFRAVKHRFSLEGPVLTRALLLILLGLFKKVVIADTLAKYVTPAFASVHTLDFLEAWTAIGAYSMELYFDFSAYGEIAMGLGSLFGIELPINFYSPYKSTNISEFWRRWHITLGRFMRDYLYIPMGGNRHGMRVMMIALFSTMLIVGLWHGAGWHYVFWGALHGVFLIINALWRKTRLKLPRVVALYLTFSAVCFSWVFFRANSIQDAFAFIGVMFGSHGFNIPDMYAGIPWLGYFFTFKHSAIITGYEFWIIGLLTVIVLYGKNVHELIADIKPSYTHAFMLTALSLLIVFNLGQTSSFLYFVF